MTIPPAGPSSERSAEADYGVEASEADRDRRRGELDQGLLKGLAWSSTGKWGGQLLSWLSTLIIARILTPEDYGIVAAATVVSGFLDLATDLGLGPALIQKEGLRKAETQQAMALTLVMGSLLALVMVAFAPIWAVVQGEPRMIPVLRVLALSVVLTGLQVVPNAILSRELRFGAIARAQLTQGASTAVVSLVLAVIIGSYWAIIVGMLVGKTFLTIMFLRSAPVLPRWPRLTEEMREMLRFGGVMTGDRFLWYARQNFDIVIIGSLLGQTALGYFSIAATLARMPMDKIAAALQPVIFPVLSRSQSEMGELRRRYLGLSGGAAGVVLPAAAGMVLTAPFSVPLLVGTQWIPAVSTTQILAAVTPFVMLWSLNAPVLNAIGRVGLNFKFTVILSALVPPAIWIGARWGIEGVALGGALATLAGFAYGFVVTWRVLGVPAGGYLKRIWAPCSATMIMVGGLLVVERLLPSELPDLVVLSIMVAVGIVTYSGALLTVHRKETTRLKKALLRAWKGEG